MNCRQLSYFTARILLMNPNLFILFLFLLIISSCQSGEEEKRARPIQPVQLVLRIWGEEGSNYFHCLAQVQVNDLNGSLSRLTAEENLMVDGISLNRDSARYSGVFYQADLPIGEFGGDHVVSLRSSDGRLHEAKFHFQPFALAVDSVGALSASELKFHLMNFPPEEDQVHLLLTDTAYGTEDINTLLPVKNGWLNIPSEMVSRMKKGPVALQVIYEKEQSLNLGKSRVKLLVSYSLGRDFELH